MARPHARVWSGAAGLGWRQGNRVKLGRAGWRWDKGKTKVEWAQTIQTMKDLEIRNDFRIKENVGNSNEAK